jgi:hypothetical protein
MILNSTHHNQKFKGGSPLAHCEKVTIWNSPRPETQFRNYRTDRSGQATFKQPEFQELDELLVEYEDIFTVESKDHGRTNKMYHCIDTADVRPIRQPPRRMPLAKQAEVSDMLDAMQRRWVIEKSDSP